MFVLLYSVNNNKEFTNHIDKIRKLSAKIGRIYEGTSNMQRLTIAKQLLGKP